MRRLAILALLAGCARPAAGPAPERDYQRVGPLELSAYVERDLGDVLGTVDVMNTGRDTVRLEYAGQCAIAVLVFDRTSPERPRWDSPGRRWTTATSRRRRSSWRAAPGPTPSLPAALRPRSVPCSDRPRCRGTRRWSWSARRRCGR